VEEEINNQNKLIEDAETTTPVESVVPAILDSDVVVTKEETAEAMVTVEEEAPQLEAEGLQSQTPESSDL